MWIDIYFHQKSVLWHLRDFGKGHHGVVSLSALIISSFSLPLLCVLPYQVQRDSHTYDYLSRNWRLNVLSISVI